MITKEKIASLICEAFRDMDYSEKYEIGEGYYMVFYDGNEGNGNYIFEYGVAVGKLDEDGDFDFDGNDTEYYLLEGFYQTFDEFFTDGDRILDSMAGQIANDYGWQ
jgi:hypothetical protein